MKKAVIFCNGIIEDYNYIQRRDFDDTLIICADGGLRHVKKLGLVPDVIVGDNDSWQAKYPDAPFVIKCPQEKDYTDTQCCIDYAIETGYKNIEIIGGFGGRRDHEFSHYCLLAYGLRMGADIKITDEHNEVTIKDKPFVLEKTDKKYVSFFPFGGCVEGFCVNGLKYCAEDIRLDCNLVQASSNEFDTSDRAEVKFKSGTMLVMLCDDVE